MKINEIGAPRGANYTTKRRGRGSGSGHGKNSCRGRKGAKKRSGRMLRAGFEGGQMPLIRRLPKRGFTVASQDRYQVVNLDALNQFNAQAVITPKELKDAGLIKSTHKQVKILGDGTLTKALTLKVHRVSQSAQKKLTAAGVTVEYLAR